MVIERASPPLWIAVLGDPSSQDVLGWLGGGRCFQDGKVSTSYKILRVLRQ